MAEKGGILALYYMPQSPCLCRQRNILHHNSMLQDLELPPSSPLVDQFVTTTVHCRLYYSGNYVSPV